MFASKFLRRAGLSRSLAQRVAPPAYNGKCISERKQWISVCQCYFLISPCCFCFYVLSGVARRWMSDISEGPVKDGRVYQVIGAVVDVEVSLEDSEVNYAS